MSGMTDIYETISRKAEEHFEWAQAYPKYGLLIATALLALWLVGLLLRWKWACHWTFNGKLWFFDDCKPKTRRRILIVLASIALIGCVSLFLVMTYLYTGFIVMEHNKPAPQIAPEAEIENVHTLRKLIKADSAFIHQPRRFRNNGEQ